MSKTLTYEQMMALFAEGRKETAELRNSMAKDFAESRKETAELRNSMAEGFAESRKETAELRASIAGLHTEVSNLKVIVEKNNASLHTEVSNLKVIVEKNNASLHTEVSNLKVIVEKNNAKLDENTAKLEKNNAKLDENTAQMKRNSRRVGELTNKLGGIIEHAILPDIVDKFKEKGFKFKDVSVRVEILNESETKHLAEVDALLENGEYVIAVEAKTEMKIKDVNDHIKRLEVLSKLSRFKGKKIYGALATAVAKEKPVNYALEQGFYVLQRPDIMGVKILDFPKGHSAKAW